MRSSRLTAALAAIVVALAAPSVAEAHLRSGTVAVGYAAGVSTLAPAVRAALAVQVIRSDRALRLTVRPGHSVVVLGYLGERFLRLDGAGVAVDAASPTAVAVGLVHGRATGWQLDAGRSSVVWHDARVQGLLPPGVRRGRWRVPLLVDGRRVELSGTIERLPPPAIWPWGVAVALLAGAVALVATTCGPDRVRRWSIALGCLAGGATCVTATVFALDAAASAGTWIAGADELVFAAVGFGALRWGTRDVRLVAAVGLGLLAVAVGASKGAVFADAAVLAVVGSAAARAFVATALGAGAAAATLGGLVLAGIGARGRR